MADLETPGEIITRTTGSVKRYLYSMEMILGGKRVSPVSPEMIDDPASVVITYLTKREVGAAAEAWETATGSRKSVTITDNPSQTPPAKASMFIKQLAQLTFPANQATNALGIGGMNVRQALNKLAQDEGLK